MTHMIDPIGRERALLRDLISGAAERARAEDAAAETYHDRVETADDLFETDTKALTARFEADSTAEEIEYTQSKQAIGDRYDAERIAARTEFAKARHFAREAYDNARTATTTAFRETRWSAAAYLEAAKTTAEEYLREQRQRVAEKENRLKAVRQEAHDLLLSWKQPVDYLDWSSFGRPEEPAGLTPGKLPRCLVEAERQFAELKGLVIPKILLRNRLALVFGILWLLSIVPAGWAALRLRDQPITWPSLFAFGTPVGGAIASGLVLVGYLLLTRVARYQIRHVAQPLGILLHAGDSRVRDVLATLNARHTRTLKLAEERHDKTVRRAKRRYRKERSNIIRERRDSFAPVRQKYVTRGTTAIHRRTAELETLEQRHAERVTALQAAFDREQKRVEGRRQKERELARSEREQATEIFGNAWRYLLKRVRDERLALSTWSDEIFPPWDNDRWQQWQLPKTVPGAVRFGTIQVGQSQIPHAVPADPALSDAALDDFSLPALLAFPGSGPLMLQAQGDGRRSAVTVLQGIMFRLLASVPPGRVRFTILDPVGLGQNFAGFMHLADHDPTLVSGRIWTDARQIDQQLEDLTTHMETIIQKYLRDRFPTLAEYNAQAGEVTEPYHVVVAANFPAGFNEDATRRLTRIAANGPRCGVHLLISADRDAPVPQGFDWSSFPVTARLVWNGSRFRWEDADFKNYSLELEHPPLPPIAEQVLDRVGRAAKEARRVEVPFSFVAPTPDRWWTGDSSAGIRVALGRALAGGPQYLTLGQGTSQHVLIAGKTGSGKSSLLHAFITNVALTYGPEEVELYLIDFKKGVEFKTYATHGLPHARVVAIESEREFGLSVLQRLDAEMRRRGELFRSAGAQDIPSYRRSGRSLPRVLFVVDEFQEFFVEEDRIAQDAAGLLDRLVRQGRAFGVHVLLGSQTLGGAFSLARSTLDQMAIRIALQCSESDAQLILSVDNTAAKLLTRPGEAIYNDANGMSEGNHLFQVVWLNDSQRENYLDSLRDRPVEKTLDSTVVFEGNAPADIRRNAPLAALLRGEVMHGGDGEPAWLGESMALGDPTAAVFRRQSGNNLGIIGQQDAEALGMLATALVSLSLAQPAPSVYIVDGQQANRPESGAFAQLAESLPCSVQLGGTRQVDAMLSEVAGEVTRRQSEESPSPPVFLAIFGLHRCRDLRKADDDFGFSRRAEDAAVPPSQRLADILRDGPPVGVHVLFWCDTLNNLQRTFDRQGIRELGLRVVMQMSIADSSTLIDSPAAARLGSHRALLACEEDGRLEKFRPYGPPSREWLDEVKASQPVRTTAE